MSITIGDYSSSLMDVYNNTTGGTSASSKLEDTLSKDYSSSSDDELMEVCKEFESYFTEQIFKALQSMVPEDESMDSSVSSTVDYFKDNLIQEYAKNSTETNSLGLAQTLYDSMKRNYNI